VGITWRLKTDNVLDGFFADLNFSLQQLIESRTANFPTATTQVGGILREASWVSMPTVFLIVVFQRFTRFLDWSESGDGLDSIDG
jgi:predicted oxidoreductase (fatty acid repression mutant protein)